VPSPRKAADSHAVLVRWMGLVDANSAGYVHGGTVMKLCDEVAGLAAVGTRAAAWSPRAWIA